MFGNKFDDDNINDDEEDSKYIYNVNNTTVEHYPHI